LETGRSKIKEPENSMSDEDYSLYQDGELVLHLLERRNAGNSHGGRQKCKKTEYWVKRRVCV
jgi:hypothetical protein